MTSELDQLVRLGRKYKWADEAERRYLEERGVCLVRSDFYSDTPTLADIDASYEYAGADDSGDAAVYDDKTIFDEAAIAAFTRALLPFAGDLEAPLEAERGFCWKNNLFSGSDAVILHALIRQSQPRTVVEIGSGYSSYISRNALDTLDGERRLLCIDPEPRAEIAGLDGIDFRRAPLQSLSADEINAVLEPGDILFYDGSHTVKTGSDTVYFYLKILPYVKAGIRVHVHDTRLPYPLDRQRLVRERVYWGEQYLVMCHLHNTARYRVLCAVELLQRRQPGLLAELMQERYHTRGGSLWFEILG